MSEEFSEGRVTPQKRGLRVVSRKSCKRGNLLLRGGSQRNGDLRVEESAKLPNKGEKKERPSSDLGKDKPNTGVEEPRLYIFFVQPRRVMLRRGILIPYPLPLGSSKMCFDLVGNFRRMKPPLPRIRGRPPLTLENFTSRGKKAKVRETQKARMKLEAGSPLRQRGGGSAPPGNIRHLGRNILEARASFLKSRVPLSDGSLARRN